MPRTYPIITNPSPILRQISAKVTEKELESKETQALLLDMAKTMHEKDGVGLAAPQIGLNKRLIAVNTKDGAICLINPEITKKSLLKEYGEEGCLSVPGYFGQVKRHKKVICKYMDSDGKNKKITASGLLARVIQHEIDHLDGILFIDKAKDLRKVELV